MQTKHVFETLTGLNIDDGGQASELEFDGSDSGLAVILRSYSSTAEHPEFEALIGKRLRVTVEVLGDEESFQGLSPEQMTPTQAAWALWNIEKSVEVLFSEFRQLRRELDLNNEADLEKLKEAQETLSQVTRQRSALRLRLAGADDARQDDVT